MNGCEIGANCAPNKSYFRRAHTLREMASKSFADISPSYSFRQMQMRECVRETKELPSTTAELYSSDAAHGNIFFEALGVQTLLEDFHVKIFLMHLNRCPLRKQSKLARVASGDMF